MKHSTKIKTILGLLLLTQSAFAAKNPKELTVISWNMLNFGDKKRAKLETFSQATKIDVLNRLGNAFKDADLIALQEVNGNNFRKALSYLRQKLQALDPKEVL